MSPDDIGELFAAFGPVEVRRMFGGAGLYSGEAMFALVVDGVIYLKVGSGNMAEFEREGLEPFTYLTGTGKRAVMSYRRMPDRLYDDPEELARWARAALAAARQVPRSERSRGAAQTARRSRAGSGTFRR